MKSLFVFLALAVLFLSINVSAQELDVFKVTEFKIVDSAGNEIPSNLAKIGDQIKFVATVENVAGNGEVPVVEFYDSTSTVWNAPATATQVAPNTFEVEYTVSDPPLKAGDNYTIYAKASQGAGETVLGNNSNFVVMSVNSSGGTIPTPETSIYLLPVMLLGVLYFVWKDDSNEAQTE